MITVQQLHALGVSNSNSLLFIAPLNDTLERYNINTKLRICHFLAQVLHESNCFLWETELSSGKQYEHRADLGNTHEGDGVKYKGRGTIQITGRDNYTVLSHVFHEDFLTHPELLATPKWATLSAGWFWDNRHLNLFADKDDLTTITHRINGGENGLADRRKYLEKCKQIIL